LMICYYFINHGKLHSLKTSGKKEKEIQ